jgi:hypothetical protein
VIKRGQNAEDGHAAGLAQHQAQDIGLSQPQVRRGREGQDDANSDENGGQCRAEAGGQRIEDHSLVLAGRAGPVLAERAPGVGGRNASS